MQSIDSLYINLTHIDRLKPETTPNSLQTENQTMFYTNPLSLKLLSKMNPHLLRVSMNETQYKDLYLKLKRYANLEYAKFRSNKN